MTVTTDRAREIERLTETVRNARKRIDECQTHYHHARRTIKQTEITKTRQAWGLALIEWVEALLTKAAAEDEHNIAERLAAMDERQRIQP